MKEENADEGLEVKQRGATILWTAACGLVAFNVPLPDFRLPIAWFDVAAVGSIAVALATLIGWLSVYWIRK